jgi:hypothetical protein
MFALSTSQIARRELGQAANQIPQGLKGSRDPMPDIYDSAFSETDARNSSPSPNGFPEGMSPSGLNDAARALMGAMKRWLNQRIPATTAARARPTP